MLWVAAFVLLAPGLAVAQDHTEWTFDKVLYEVNVRQYTTEGTFEAFEAHLDRLQELGVGILWFMPIHPIGQENRLGSLGSYYAVRNYLAVNPEFGTLNDFKKLVDAVHDRGMYVMLDWVANHTAWDATLTTEHPEWYVTNSAGEFIPPPGTNWSDVIELDYSEPGLRSYMIDALKFWVEEVGVDGFRFDAVDFVPEDFWLEATAALVATKPDIFLLAEGAGPQYYNLGFHMTFGWQLYGFGGGVLTDVADGEANAAALYSFARDEAQSFGDAAYRLYFTANHDENSWHGTTEELFGDAAEAFAVLTATLRGMPLIYSGQEAGLDKRLAFFDKDEIPWRDHPNAELYATLFRLKRENQALWNGLRGGSPRRVANSNESAVFSFTRQGDGDRVLAAFNATSEAQSVTLTSTGYAGEYVDVFTDATRTLDAGVVLDLPPWGYAVFAADATDTHIETGSSRHEFRLEQNHPNPFSNETAITYHLPHPGTVNLTVSDVLGRTIRTVEDGPHASGQNQIRFPAHGLASGVYTYRLSWNGHVEARRMVVLR